MVRLSESTECTTSRVSPDVSYELGAMVMCRCKFTDCNKCTLLWGMLTVGEAVRGEAGGTQETSVFSARFFCETKTTLKIKSI